MAARVLFGLITLFFGVMNFLLWRAEFGPRNAGADAVPLSLVWRKILTAPDPSSLGIWKGDQRLGFGHWVTSVGEEFAEMEEAPPEGNPGKIQNYQLRLDGNLNLPGDSLRVRYECSLKLATNHDWQEFNLRLSSRPTVWELRAVAAEQTVRFHTDDGQRQFNRVFRFSELRNPASLVAEFAGPAGLGFVAALGLPHVNSTEPSALPSLRWEASSVFMIIGHEPVRVYQLQTRLLDRFDIRVFVSRAGEILRVELPSGIVLRHDQIRTSDSDRP